MSSVDYVFAALPLVLAHVVVPPLSYFQGERVYVDDHMTDVFTELIYPMVPAQLLRASYVVSLTRDAGDPVISVKSLTALFVHGSYSHMFSNVTAMLTFGLPVYTEFGSNGLFFVFLAGGVFASLPSFLREDQKKEVARLVASKFTVDPGTGNSLYNRLVGVWNRRGAAHLGTLAKGLFPTKECGSSGGVCALMGCHLVLQLRDASNIVYWSMCARCVCPAWLRDRLPYAHSRPPFVSHTHTCQHRRTPPTAPPPHALASARR